MKRQRRTLDGVYLIATPAWTFGGGNAYGLLSGLWIDPRVGTGVAYFATGVPNDAPRSTRRSAG